jgi:transcriptional regulator with XRE-family HTH domain
MEAMKLTKSELCKRTGISRPTLDSLLEGGDVKMRTIEALAQALNVSVGFFFDGEHHNNITNNGNVHLQQQGSGNIQNAEEIATLKEKIELLEKLLAEKERVISLLMKGTNVSPLFSQTNESANKSLSVSELT